MKQTIRDIFGIDLNDLLSKATFVEDELPNDDKKASLIYNLHDKFLDVFDQIRVTVFKGEFYNLEFRSPKNEAVKIKSMLDRIIEEYGPDENKLLSKSWDQFEDFGWWFTNENHDPISSDPHNNDPIHYGLMINHSMNKGCDFIICNYVVLQPELKDHFA